VTAPLPLPAAAELVAKMVGVVEGKRATDEVACTPLVLDLVESNLRQWDLENTTREPDASDAVVASAKREIDRLNLGRHHLVEEIDAAIDRALDQRPDAPFATESPGMVLDRMSVLVIRRARTADAASQQPAKAERVTSLDLRLAALSVAFDTLMDDLRAGSRRFLRYEHLKIYESDSHAD
jgi:ribosomal 50S subunit-associated protein YjgA (DUF615 family)